MTPPKIALLRSSNKAFEERVPVHPAHLQAIPAATRDCIVIEQGYGQKWDHADADFQKQGFPVEARASLLASADFAIMVRPTAMDLLAMKQHASGLGWFHCVQNQDIAQVAAAKQLTLICMESLYNDLGNSLFVENSQITGRQAILHALHVSHILANAPKKIIVIGHGNAGRSALQQLLSLEFTDITCYSRREAAIIPDKIDQIHYQHGTPPLSALQNADIIINATQQDIYHPIVFVHHNERPLLKPGVLLIDISCDKYMGFDFGNMTTLDQPIQQYGHVLYYAIDHLPTLDYDAASLAISNQIIPLLPLLIECFSSHCPPILERAMQIKQGQLINPEIHYFAKTFLNIS